MRRFFYDSIINTGFGNINSIKNIYYENSIDTKIINTSEDLESYSGIILPGMVALIH